MIKEKNQREDASGSSDWHNTDDGSGRGPTRNADVRPGSTAVCREVPRGSRNKSHLPLLGAVGVVQLLPPVHADWFPLSDERQILRDPLTVHGLSRAPLPGSFLDRSIFMFWVR